MTRAFTLCLLLSGCAVEPVVYVNSDPIVGIGPDATAVTLDYVAAVCAFHAQPSCVASRAKTCADGLVLADPEVCHDLLESTAFACPGAAEELRDHAEQVEACTAHLRALTCEEQPACGPDGAPLDASGPCDAVAAMVMAACEDLADPE